LTESTAKKLTKETAVGILNSNIDPYDMWLQQIQSFLQMIGDHILYYKFGHQSTIRRENLLKI
jgi:hypothetical protein